MEIYTYTGIGSRKTPSFILNEMKNLAMFLATEKLILRTGGADGADAAFEDGVNSVGGNLEVYLPWKNFNDNSSERYSISNNALELAQSVHPNWNNLADSVKRLHARNCYQVLGENLNTPSDFLVCWTPDGCSKLEERSINTGGTGTAIALACLNKIPVFNLKNEKDIESLNNFLDYNNIKYQLKLRKDNPQISLF